MKAVAITPTTTGVAASSSVFLYYSGGIITSSACGTGVNHAVLVIGYGRDNALNMDYWLLKNSWGTWWGEKGYFRL